MSTVSTSPAKKSYHHGDLREALLAAALAILEEGGDPKALTLREAARRAGVSAMAPYRHFADKDALIAGVALIGFERFRDALAAADADPDPRAALVAQGVAYVDFAGANPALFRLMFGANAPKADSRLSEVGAEAYGVLATRVASLVAPDRAADWTLACWSIVHGIAALALAGKLDARQDAPRVLTDRILRLLAIME
jgi:AcrR family transcriptional regulator